MSKFNIKKDEADPTKSVDPMDFLNLSPAMFMLLAFARLIADYLGLPFVVTSMISDRKKAQAKTKTHARGDGVDIRTYDWPKPMVKRFADALNSRCAHLAPVGKKVCVIEEDHIHLQTKENLTLSNFH